MADSQTVTKQGQFTDTRRDFIRDGGWVAGCDTLLWPGDIAQGAYSWSLNIINRGGIVSTRPRRKLIFLLPGNRAQGMTGFVTLDQVQYLVWAIDGLIYQSVFPFKTYAQIGGLSFDPNARQIYFSDVVQAAHYDNVGNIVFQTPVKYLFIQDGTNSPGWWDGTNVFQPFVDPNNPKYSGVPIGSRMASSGGRLWIAVGRSVFASDFVIPTQFREGKYLAEASGFQFPRRVTALLQAPQDTGLFTFTDTGVYALQSNIADRTQWQTTPQFQSTITEYVGCIASFSPIYQHGLPWWYSAKGFLSMDMALNTHITSAVYPRDGEMRRSKARLSPNLTAVCTGIFENTLLVAVPYASQFNRHTWIEDGAVAPKLNSNMGSCWTGVWTGTYPVQFVNFVYQGIEHNYEISYSNGYVRQSGVNYPISIWENFTLAIQDADATPVKSTFETRIFTMPNDDLMTACFVEVFITQLSGTATFSFSIAGIAGLYTKLSTSTFRADSGPFFSPLMTTIYYGFPGQANTIIESFRPQNRYARSPEVVLNVAANSTHFIEVGYNDMIDRGFQCLFQWTGNLALRGLKFWYRPYSAPSFGALAVDESAAPKAVVEA